MLDAARVGIAELLAAGSQVVVRDVETHRAPIDEVIADIYQRWQGDLFIHSNPPG